MGPAEPLPLPTLPEPPPEPAPELLPEPLFDPPDDPLPCEPLPLALLLPLGLLLPLALPLPFPDPVPDPLPLAATAPEPLVPTGLVGFDEQFPNTKTPATYAVTANKVLGFMDFTRV
jgi:hypothetical protein